MDDLIGAGDGTQTRPTSFQPVSVHGKWFLLSTGCAARCSLSQRVLAGCDQDVITGLLIDSPGSARVSKSSPGAGRSPAGRFTLAQGLATMGCLCSLHAVNTLSAVFRAPSGMGGIILAPGRCSILYALCLTGIQQWCSCPVCKDRVRGLFLSTGRFRSLTSN